VQICNVNIDLGHIEKSDDGNDDKIVKEKALKTSFKKQLKGKCHVCGKIGHKGTDCWTIEANKEKRPTSYHGRENADQDVRYFFVNQQDQKERSQSIILPQA